ncbi:type VI secretion system baseplate subunit TssG [Algicella marina]|uniref:Type VI secretion system baseplate subunit TssG n=1 Tax=Algicella marina TaxID=2683284 RepID=A0A6P1T1D2_9RHOB|nr:type VI secretion system baseplate subunit TssG [Algicella marina]QHQ36548.1 type VI secretion system baseplate subunit TssG [Algicella marina]
MATGNGPRPNDLKQMEALQARPERFHLFHALRILDASSRGKPRMGETRRPKDDPVRLGQEAELAFPPSTLASILKATGKRPPLVINRFFGLFGPHGPLPLHMTEYARNRQRHEGDRTLIAFGDMLIHRLMTLFFRAWTSGQPAPSHDREGSDDFSSHVAALAGLHGKAMADRDAMPDSVKLHFAATMGRQTKSAEGLAHMLSAFFEAPVRVQQFIGSWLELEPEDCWRIGVPTGLGRGSLIGNRVWSRASKFRIVIGPMALADYQRLLPGGESLKRLRAVVRNHVGDRLDWDLNLVLGAEEVPKPVLGKNVRLGHVGWIGSGPHARDADDLLLHPNSS